MSFKIATGGGGICTLEMGNQNRVGTVSYVNAVEGGVGVVKVTAHLTNIAYTRQGSCTTGANGTFYDSTYEGEWLLKGSGGGTPTSVEVFSAGSPPPSIFAAEEAPVKISGKINQNRSIFAFHESAVQLACTEHNLSGESATATSESITVGGSYHGCTFDAHSEAEGTSVSMGKCSYVLHANGGFDIVGASCASEPITISTPACTYRVGPQSATESFIRYANEGSGKLRRVKTLGIGGASGLTYTTSGPACWGGTGTFTDGVYRGNDKFTATNSSGAPQGISIE
jgi:hypothetical protein